MDPIADTASRLPRAVRGANVLIPSSGDPAAETLEKEGEKEEDGERTEEETTGTVPVIGDKGIEQPTAVVPPAIPPVVAPYVPTTPANVPTAVSVAAAASATPPPPPPFFV